MSFRRNEEKEKREKMVLITGTVMIFITALIGTQLIVEGSPIHREAVFFHRASRTLILADLIENFEPGKLAWWMWPLVRLGGIADPDGAMPRDMRATFRRGRAQLRQAVEIMIGWAPDRVILAHGRWYRENGAAELRRAFRFVLQ